MEPPGKTDHVSLAEHLSQLSTAWTMLVQAKGGMDAKSAAQEQMLKRYGSAIYRYLLGAARDRDVADELFQEFALRFLRGDFRGANPERGRFRAFLKTALYHLVVDHQRKRRSPLLPLSWAGGEPVEPSPAPGSEDFTKIWRSETMARAWEALAQLEKRTGQPLYSVLRLRTDCPELESPQLAEQLSATLGRIVTPGWVRKKLHQAREKYTDFLLDDIAGTLAAPTLEDLEQELSDLELLEYCKEALQRRARSC